MFDCLRGHFQTDRDSHFAVYCRNCPTYFEYEAGVTLYTAVWYGMVDEDSKYHFL